MQTKNKQAVFYDPFNKLWESIGQACYNTECIVFIPNIIYSSKYVKTNTTLAMYSFFIMPSLTCPMILTIIMKFCYYKTTSFKVLTFCNFTIVTLNNHSLKNVSICLYSFKQVINIFAQLSLKYILKIILFCYYC